MIFCLLMAATCCPVFSAEWKASVVKQLKALVSFCVVVPCSFTHSGGELPASKLRAIWHLLDAKKENIYHEDPTKISDSFRDRTKILGQLGQGNCTLEIIEIKDHENSPFCFRIELVPTPDDPPTKKKILQNHHALCTENYNLIIIPVTVAVGTAMIFGFFCIFMVKKYKRRVAQLQSREGSMWNRMSRLSRR
ncbi:myelin-associated glycoprotein-like [Melanotaenia boesemani]|uniref:myelin-associated glycoprotein-like n=1 Tax=Melanotaenia boesemani TaxID=1250792 RepID=UPI001C04CBE5|nr:myelin-associated glycoprotein-like [Melanotaenia boesemani]